MVRIVRAGPAARRVAAALPVIALAATGIAFAARSDTPTATALSVPDQAITQNASPDYPSAGPAPAPMQLPPIYETYTTDWARVDIPAELRGALQGIGSLAPVRLDVNGIPSIAVAAYQRAAGVLGRLDPGCGVDWALLGAIGRVESNHARFGGNTLDSAGIARPGIIGIPLDGSRGTARISDTDGGRLDRDSVYDRAVGPMQFIPSTWRMAGHDGDADGVANPQDLTDAVTSAGVLLCSGRGDLRDPKAAYDAVFRYNHSDDYVRTVLSIADAYRRGVTVVPMSSIPAARPASGSGTATPEGSGFGYAGSSGSGSSSSAGSGSTTKPAPAPSSSPKPSPSPKPSGEPSQPAKPAPRLPVPLPSVPGVPLPKPTVPLPSVPLPTPTLSTEIARLLALPHLALLPGDPAGLVRVLDPLTAKVVCLLDEKVVTCPTGGLLG